MSDAGHPLWSFLRLVVIAAVASLGLWLNASNFDETEIRSLLWILVGMGGMEATGLTTQTIMRRIRKPKDDN